MDYANILGSKCLYIVFEFEGKVAVLNNFNISLLGNHSFKTADELENFCIGQQRSMSFLNVIGTVFNKDKLPDSLDYTIRHSSSWDTYFGIDMKYRFSENTYSGKVMFVKYFSKF